MEPTVKSHSPCKKKSKGSATFACGSSKLLGCTERHQQSDRAADVGGSMNGSAIKCSVVAALAGALYGWVAINFWGFYSSNNPVTALLMETLLGPGRIGLFRARVFAHDVCVNIVLAVPFAAVLVALRPLNRWPFALVSGLAALVVVNWGTEWSLRLVQSSAYWVEVGMVLLAFPVAFALMRRLCHALKYEDRASAVYEIERPSSFFETPSASNDFTRRSIETEGSPASILATRD
jgi:hypothetical protein